MNTFQMSISGAFLIIVVVIIRSLTLHKLPKKMFIILWGAVVWRLITPFSVPSRFSFYTAVDRLKLLSEKTLVTPLKANDTFYLKGVPYTDQWVEIGKQIAPISTFIIIWLVGMLVCFMFFSITYIKNYREFQTSLPIEENFIPLCLQAHSMWRAVQIRQSDKINVPLTYGIFRPVILLPKITDWTDEIKLQYILTHEFMHIRNFDALKKLLLAYTLCVHWFNPFVWVMYVLANRDIELFCDEAVVRTFGENIKSTYAMTLINMEENKNRLTPLCNNFSKNAIEERIVSIMNIKKNSFVGIVVALLLVIGVPIVFATNSAVQEEPLKNSATVTEEIVPDYPVNGQGQTYGRGPYLEGGLIKEPELMAAIGTNGVEGYVKTADLNGPSFTSPEEAIIYQKKRQAAGPRAIPLYESDGKTVIGEFIVGTGNLD